MMKRPPRAIIIDDQIVPCDIIHVGKDKLLVRLQALYPNRRYKDFLEELRNGQCFGPTPDPRPPEGC
jgi:hypothetical protein